MHSHPLIDLDLERVRSSRLCFIIALFFSFRLVVERRRKNERLRDTKKQGGRNVTRAPNDISKIFRFTLVEEGRWMERVDGAVLAPARRESGGEPLIRGVKIDTWPFET